ncbi:MAG: hypothetical protein ACKO13_02150 [Cytophagales bacterium]
MLFRFLIFSVGAILFTINVCSQSMQTVVQAGHDLAVLSVAISLDSGFVATGSSDKTAKLWDLSTGRVGAQLFGSSALNI